MVRPLVKMVVHRMLRSLPLGTRKSLIRICTSSMTEKEKFRTCIPTVPGLLDNIKENGLSPHTIVDIGANVGDWARMASKIFPSSRMLMLDGNPDYDSALRDTVRDIGPHAEYFITLLGGEERHGVTFY